MRRRAIIRLLAASGAWIAGPPARTLFAAEPRPVFQKPEDDAESDPLLPLFPLPLVLLPGASVPLHIFEERYKEMVRDCLRYHRDFGILLVRRDSFEHVGTTASIAEVVRRYEDGQMDIVVRGRQRFEVSFLNREKSYLRGVPQFLEDDRDESPSEELRQQATQLNARLMKLLELEESTPPQADVPEAPLSFRIMADVPAEQRWEQHLLELNSERERLNQVIRYLQQLIGMVERSPAHRPPPGTL